MGTMQTMPATDCTETVPVVEMDLNSTDWVQAFNTMGPSRDLALASLHAMLLRVARAETRRRSSRLRLTGPEVDDIAYHAAADAVLAIMAKIDQFRGESRFTTWAYKFVIFEVSTKIGRHFWRRPGIALDAEDWDRLPDRFGLDPINEVEAKELIAAVRTAVDDELTDRQRRVFVAIVVNGVPLDALVAELGSNRNAIYKTMFDARGKLRAALVANGYLEESARPL
jgi:RNA polymerase sigma-70 factor (ECF subfamily)